MLLRRRMMPGDPLISSSVGRNGKNLRDDVIVIQNLINEHLPIPFRPIEVNGHCQSSTITLIEEIQRRELHMQLPDGRVDPGGNTFRVLTGKCPIGHAAVQDAHTAAHHAHGKAHHKHPPAPVQHASPDVVNSPRVKAMLDVLAYTEGTGDDYGKVADGIVLKSPHDHTLIGKKNVSVTDFSQHPEILVKWSETIKTTAAGRYQFILPTWKGLQMADFTPASQDTAAVTLMQQGGMIPLLLSGKPEDFEKAVNLGAKIWASLPTATGGSEYAGQPARHMAKIKQHFEDALKKYQGAATAAPTH
jgi:muramidase (phage lysozyme)